MLAVVLVWVLPRLQPTTGTLLVVVSGRGASTMSGSTLMLRESDGPWVTVGDVSGSVPAAPEEREALTVPIPVGVYDGVRFGADTDPVFVTVTAGQVEPVLLGIESNHLLAGAVYPGNDEVNLGLGELSGKFVAMPRFDLVDQSNQAFDNLTIAGRDTVIAAFHTTCHETCPLYTALLLQLAKRIPETVMLAEVTTDPGTDTPSVLAGYAGRIGAGWRFVTGTPQQVASFWKPFGVEPASGDVHTSTLVLVDRHGYVRLIYRGAPDVGHDIPASLTTSLSAAGLKELASGGDGWGAPDVLQALVAIAGPERVQQSSDGKAPDFTLTATDGSKVSLAELVGKPLVINFWRTDCPPCQAEMPMLQQLVGPQSGARLVLIDWGDSADAARAFLQRLGIRQPALLDTDLSVGKSYRLVGLPTTVFVRRDGTIADRHVGQLDQRVLVAELSILTSQ